MKENFSLIRAMERFSLIKFFLLFSITYGEDGDIVKPILKQPSVLIVSLVRNKAHTLPMFLTYLQEQEYPKDRIALWLATDHNEDNSREILEAWLVGARNYYHSVHYQFDESEKNRFDVKSKFKWSENRFLDLIKMKESALEYARKASMDYVFFIDADIFLTLSTTLKDLVSMNLPIVAPMLTCEGFRFTNFWCEMTEHYEFQFIDEYASIRDREMVGEFDVPVVHSAFLIDLRRTKSDYLTFNKTKLQSVFNDMIYNGPTDDKIVFAMSAKFTNTPMILSNTKHYGFITSSYEDEEIHSLANIKVELLKLHRKTHILPNLQKFVIYPEKSKLTFSEIYMINLKRRPEKRAMQEAAFDELGINCTFIEAVDGKDLTEKDLVEKGINFLKEYENIHGDLGKMTMGEVGCFLSHYKIWEKMVAENQQEILIFEDDVRFEYNFTNRILSAMKEARTIGGWDLIYLDRFTFSKSEPFHPMSKTFLLVDQSYFANAYALSLEGAKKLLAAKPLKKMLPVDEFLPIMYNKHQNKTWMEHFKNRNLVAWSIHTRLARPTYYYDDEEHISDTSNSKSVQHELLDVMNKNNNKMHDSNEL